MGEKMLGALCGSSLSQDWMDAGTSSLMRHRGPGSTGDAGSASSSPVPVGYELPGPSLLEELRRQFIVASMLGLRKGLANPLAAMNPMGSQAVERDQAEATRLLQIGAYDRAFEIATGLGDYFQVYHQAKAAGGTASETTVALFGHLTGFNQATEAVTGEDLTGKPIGMVERFMLGLDGLVRIASTAMTVSAAVPGGGVRFGRPVSPVFRVAGRDIMVVETSIGRQPFYRSSGVNSNMPGEWLPVDEIRMTDGWFNKANYVHGPGLEPGQPLHRFGTEEFRRISQRLGEMHIGPGQPVPAGQMESADATMNRILDFFNARRTPTTFDRPMPDP